ncbi:hypothetical protein JCM11641_000617 [Rhodosporidiobolus odoratus]
MQLPDAKHRLSFPGLDGVYGWVSVDGEPLEVYGAEVLLDKAIAYIAVSSGQQFAVHRANMRKGYPAHAHVVQVYVDGSHVAGSVYKRGHSLYASPRGSEARHRCFGGLDESETVLRPFAFGNLALTDEGDEACTNEQVLKSIGTIQLRYMRIRNLEYNQPKNEKLTPTLEPLHERAKKVALSHRTEFKAPEAKEVESWITFDWTDTPEDAFSSVEFRYRSKELLQLEGYIADESPYFGLLLPSTSPATQAGPSQVRHASSLAAARPPSHAASASVDLDFSSMAGPHQARDRQDRIAKLKRELALL